MSASIFESSDMLSLFETPVWMLQLPAGRYEPVNAALLAVVAALRPGAARPTCTPGVVRPRRLYP